MLLGGPDESERHGRLLDRSRVRLIDTGCDNSVRHFAAIVAACDLVVAGEDQVQLVGGKEYIRIAGVVRPEDVLSNNVVLSTQMAEAHIEFSGDGQTYLAPQMGFLQRLFLNISELWPGDWFK